MRVGPLLIAMVALHACTVSTDKITVEPQDAIEASARLAWVDLQKNIQVCMKKNGYVYVPVTPPQGATPGFVFPAVTRSDFAQLAEHGYGLARSVETAVHHEQDDRNSVIFESYSDSERRLYGSAKLACIEAVKFNPDPKKILASLAALRTQWLADPDLEDEWTAWRECMRRAGVVVARRDESVLFWAREKLEEGAVGPRLQMNPPNEETLRLAEQIEAALSESDVSCLSQSGLAALRRKWGKLTGDLSLR
jgi:hypothetical protein